MMLYYLAPDYYAIQVANHKFDFLYNLNA